MDDIFDCLTKVINIPIVVGKSSKTINVCLLEAFTMLVE